MRRLLALSGLIVVLSSPAVVFAQQAEDEADQPRQTETERQEETPEVEATNDDNDDETDEDEDDELIAEVDFGVIGGPAVTYISADQDAFGNASDLLLRYSIGVHGHYSYRDIVGVAVEAFFSRRGWNTQGTVGGQEIDTTYEFSYVDIPVLLQLGLPLDKQVVPKLFAGPHGSVFIEGSREGETGGPFLGGGDEFDIDDDEVQQLQFGLTVGLGIDLEMPQGATTFDIRYMHNFTRVFDEPEDDNVHHRAFMAMVGLLF